MSSPDQATPGWGDQSSDRLGYDGAGRMICKRWLGGGIDEGTGAYNDPTSIVGQTTQYDRANNKLFERALHAESRSTLYEPINPNGEALGGYDSINRLRQYQRGILSEGPAGGDPAPAGGSVKDPITLPNTNESAGYVLDGLGNWRRFVTDPVGGNPGTQVRQHNNLNEITRTSDGGGPVLFSYDGVPGASNGNLTNDGVRSYEWDALNRLKKVYKDPNGTPTLIGEYTFDALGRRIRKVVSNGGLSGTIPNGTTDFVYNSRWQCLEERDGSNDPFKQYVWGHYIDELVQLTTFTTINGNAAGAYYPLQDTLYRTTALADDVGDLVETYDYDPYGNTLIFTAAGTGSDWWADDASQGPNPTCEQLFTGQRYDAEKVTYQYRNRDYSAETGRFLSKDPLGPNANYYWYVMGQPSVFVDPTGQVLQIPVQGEISFFLDLINKLCPGNHFQMKGFSVEPIDPNFCGHKEYRYFWQEGFTCPSYFQGLAHPERAIRKEVCVAGYEKTKFQYSCHCVCEMIQRDVLYTLQSNAGEYSCSNFERGVSGVEWENYNLQKGRLIRIYIGVELSEGLSGYGATHPPSDKHIPAPHFIILGHEMCGHAYLNKQHGDAPFDYSARDQVVERENWIRGEHSTAELDWGFRDLPDLFHRNDRERFPRPAHFPPRGCK